MKYLSLIFFILLLTGCSEEKVKPQIDKSMTNQEIPTQESWNFKMLFTDLGKLRAVLFADHALVFELKRETLLEKVRIDFYNEEEIKTTTLTSKRGRVDDITKNMYAIDSVVAISDSGVTLTTDELMWRNKDRKIVSDKFVTIKSPKEQIQGYGFESDQQLNNYVIFKPVVVAGSQNSKTDSLK